MKKILTLLLSFFVIASNAYAIDYSLPQDLPTIEILIECHKIMKENEKASLAQITAITGEQELSTKKAININEIKSTINKKMNDINSYIVLGTTIVQTFSNLLDLENDYSKFLTQTGMYVLNKPQMIGYYANAQVQIYNTVKDLYKAIASYSLSGVNILKASMDEKFQMINIINEKIHRIKYIIFSTKSYITYVSNGNLPTRMARDIIPQSYKDELLQKLAEQWKKHMNFGESE